MNTIPEIICKYRTERKLSQTEFAKALVEHIPGGLTKQAVSLWETGQQKPSLFPDHADSELQRLAA